MSFLCSYAILLYPSSTRRKCPLSMLEDVHCQNIYLLKGVLSIFFLILWITGVFQIRFTFNPGHLGFTEGYSMAIVHVIRYRIAAPLAYWQNMLFDLWTVILRASLAIRNLLYIQATVKTYPPKPCTYIYHLTFSMWSARCQIPD